MSSKYISKKDLFEYIKENNFVDAGRFGLVISSDHLVDFIDSMPTFDLQAIDDEHGKYYDRCVDVVRELSILFGGIHQPEELIYRVKQILLEEQDK